MMRIIGDVALRSIINEAGRQASFYEARNQEELYVLWSGIEALAFAAKNQRQPLSLLLGDCTGTSPIIKPCE